MKKMNVCVLAMVFCAPMMMAQEVAPAPVCPEATPAVEAATPEAPAKQLCCDACGKTFEMKKHHRRQWKKCPMMKKGKGPRGNRPEMKDGKGPRDNRPEMKDGKGPRGPRPEMKKGKKFKPMCPECFKGKMKAWKEAQEAAPAPTPAQ